MARLLLNTAKIVGTASVGWWSQVHTINPSETDLVKDQLVVVLLLSGADVSQEEMVVRGKEAITSLDEEYQKTDKPGLNLKAIVERLADRFTDGLKMELAAAVLSGDTAYLAVYGSGRVMLKRGEELRPICFGRPGEIEVASGNLKENDFIFMGTGLVFAGLTEEVISSALEDSTVEEAAEAIIPIIYGQGMQKAAAGAVIKVKTEAEEVISAPEPVEAAVPVETETKKNRFSLKSLNLSPLKKLAGRLVKKRNLFLKTAAVEKQPQISRKKRKFVFLTVVVISLLLLVSVFWGVYRQRLNRRSEAKVAFVTEVRQKIEESRSLADLNLGRAEQLLSEAGALLDSADLQLIEADLLEELRKEIDETLLVLRKDYFWQELPLLFDLKIIKETARADRILLDSESLLVLDSENGSVYRLDLENNDGRIIAGGDNYKKAVDFTADNTNLYLLLESGILQRNFNKETEKTVIESDSGWGKIADLGTYNGSLYLLDQERGDLYRYAAIDSGFGTKQSWVKGEKDSLSAPVSLAIDGSIWFLTDKGEVLKFTQGFADPFSMSGLTDSFDRPTMIFTAAGLEKLYVLDQNNNRVVVLGKDGNYKGQYRWAGEAIKEMAVSEEKGRLWLLGADKIFQLELK